MTGVVLAVDIGGTKTAVALADRDDVLLRTEVAPSRAADGPEAVIGVVVELAERLLADAGDMRLRGIGVGTAGVVDTGTGTIVSATDTFANWVGTPVAAMLRAGLAARLDVGASVIVQNDVDAHAAGEFRHGAAVGAASVLIVAVGTGIGAGIILDGHPLRGAHHVAGEIAHVPAPDAAHLMCPCGRPGHLEAIGSGIGMHRHFLSLGGNPIVPDARAIAELARTGDATAARAIADSAAAIGRVLAGAATLIDPERIVITGGVPQIGETWWTPMEQAFRAEAIDALQHTPLLPGLLGDDAPLRGAAASAWKDPS